MTKIAVVGGTGKLGRMIINTILESKEDISISSIRGGNIVGEHKVIFSNSKDEVIELKHQISSRKAFASGAVSVAKWLKKQPVGLYDMDDYCK